MNKKGFTLIEILLVVLIMLVLSSIALPSFASVYRRQVLSKTVDGLVSKMRYAQNRAINFNEEIKFEFETMDSKVVSVEYADPFIRFYPDGKIDKTTVEVCAYKKCITIVTGLVRGQIKVVGS